MSRPGSVLTRLLYLEARPLRVRALLVEEVVRAHVVPGDVARLEHDLGDHVLEETDEHGNLDHDARTLARLVKKEKRRREKVGGKNGMLLFMRGDSRVRTGNERMNSNCNGAFRSYELRRLAISTA